MLRTLLLAVMTLSASLAHGCLNNYEFRFLSEWQEGGGWKTNAHIKPNFDYQLRNWELRIEFKEPLHRDMKAWIAKGYGGSAGQSKVVLKPMQWNRILYPAGFDMSYFVTFKNPIGQDHLKCVEFCGVKAGGSDNICDSGPPPPVATTKAPTKGPVVTTTQPKPATTIPTPPPNPTTTSAPLKTTTKHTTTKQKTSATSKTTRAPTTVATAKTTTTSNPGSCSPKYDYSEVLEKSILFYEAQRSGKLPADQRVKWRHDSTMTDGSDVGLDLTGGYFDAGDYVKFGFPMAATITNLAWGMLEFKKGYTSSGQYEYGLKAIKWGTDYFIKCHPSAHRLFGQVGDGDVDHSAWGRPEDMKLLRPAYDIDENRPGSDLAGETAAALAASSLVFKEVDADYSDVLLQHAKELYSFAMDFRGLYHESIPDATEFYKSHNGYKDELAWASLWLFRATGDATYKNNFLKEFDNDAYSQSPGEFSWDNKWHGVQVLAQQLNVSDKDYLGNLKSALEQPKKTAKGLFYVKRWGPLRHAANLAFLARVASTIVDDKFYNEFARSQINYILGDAGRSYVVGFGTNPPQQPHHRSSSCPVNGPCSWDNLFSSSPNPQILYGALVGGPDANDRYTDKRADYIKNEVTVDYNAGFQSAIAGLIQLAEEENDC
uniref:Endoglucanase n=1 Tax=Clytia hemisphaerica TaxID=252671 RepID=A0A7M5TR51_9CNID